MSLTSQQYAALAKDAYDEPPETGASSRLSISVALPINDLSM